MELLANAVLTENGGGKMPAVKTNQKNEKLGLTYQSPGEAIGNRERGGKQFLSIYINVPVLKNRRWLI